MQPAEKPRSPKPESNKETRKPPMPRKKKEIGKTRSLECWRCFICGEKRENLKSLGNHLNGHTEFEEADYLIGTMKSQAVNDPDIGQNQEKQASIWTAFYFDSR